MKKHVQVKLFATLARYAPPNAEDYPLKKGTTIRDLLQQLEIPENEAKLIFINGIRKTLTEKLMGGERIGIFPPVGGG